MANKAVITGILDRVSEASADPAPDVFRALFRRRPRHERLFALDVDGGVRGSMVETAVICILDHLDGGALAANVLAAERAHHPGYGVPKDEFDELFDAMGEAFAALLGEGWSEADDAEWRRLVGELKTAPGARCSGPGAP